MRSSCFVLLLAIVACLGVAQASPETARIYQILSHDGKYPLGEDLEQWIVNFNYDGTNMEELMDRLAAEHGVLITEEMRTRLMGLQVLDRMDVLSPHRQPPGDIQFHSGPPPTPIPEFMRMLDQKGDELLEKHFPDLVARQQELMSQIKGPPGPDRTELHERLSRLTAEMREIKMRLAQAGERSEELAELVAREYKLERQIYEKQELFEQTGEAEKQELRTQLRSLLDETFEVSQEIREYEAKEIEAELERIRRLLEQRRENKSIIIDRRLQELTKGVDPYEW